MTRAGAPASGRRFRIHVLAAAVAVLCALVAGWLLTRPDPQRLFQHALSTARRDPAAAAHLFRRALNAAGGHFPDAQIGLCDVLAQQGDWDDAARVFAETSTAECRIDLLLEFGREARDADRIDEAERSLQEVARRSLPDRREALELLMGGYHRWGLQDRLIDTARELTQLDPRHFDAWAVLTKAFRVMNMDQELFDALEEALENAPPSAYRREFEYQLVQLLISRAETARAIDGLANLRRDEGDSFGVRACAIELHRLQGRLDEALEIAQTLFNEPKQQANAHLIRGSLWIDLGKYGEAVADLEQAVAGQPFSSPAHFKLSEAYRASGRKTQALDHSQIANNLLAARMKINALLNRRAKERLPSDQVAEQLAQLYQEVGNETQSAHWKDQAARAARKQESRRP